MRELGVLEAIHVCINSIKFHPLPLLRISMCSMSPKTLFEMKASEEYYIHALARNPKTMAAEIYI